MNINSIERLEARRLLATVPAANAAAIYPADAVSLNGVSYFGADDGVHGRELWRTDGTSNGTMLVQDIVPGPTGSDVSNLSVVGDALVFITHNPDGSSSALWRSDGTNAGTVQLKTFDANTRTNQAAVIGGKLVVPAYNPTSGAADLWVSDGTGAGTVIASHLFTQADADVPELLVIGSRALLQQSGHLFATDGTGSGTIELSDPSGTDATRPMFCRIPTRSGGRAVFFASRSDPGQLEVWGTDGTLAGTELLVSGGASGTPDGFTSWGVSSDGLTPSLLLFQTLEGNQHKLWNTDGTRMGTGSVATTAASIDQSISLDTNWGFWNRKGLYLLHDPSGEYQLWVADMETNGITQVKPLMSGTLSAPPVVIDGMAFFIVSDADGPNAPARSTQLWRTDGLAQNTVMVQDLTSAQIAWSDTTLSSVDGQLVVATKQTPIVIDPASVLPPMGFSEGVLHYHSPNGGIVRINGTAGDDNIRVYRMQNHTDRFVVDFNGVKQTFPIADIYKLMINGWGGNDGIAFVERNGLLPIRSMITGGSGNDTIHGGSSRDTIFGGAGDDFIKTGRSIDSIDGGTGNDTIYGSTGDDTLIGGPGADSLFGQRDNDLLSGGDDVGIDHLDGGTGTDMVFGKAAIDNVFHNGQKDQDPLEPDEVLLW